MNDQFYAFMAKDAQKEVVVKLIWESGWTDICDHLVGYLQACGFIVDGADIADYFHKSYGYLIEAKDE